MSLCDYPNFYLSQFGVMTSSFSTKIVPDFYFFFVFDYDPDDPNPTRKTQLDYTPTQIGKTDSKMSHSKSGLLCKIVKWFRLAHFLVSVLRYISISFNTKEV